MTIFTRSSQGFKKVDGQTRRPNDRLHVHMGPIDIVEMDGQGVYLFGQPMAYIYFLYLGKHYFRAAGWGLFTEIM